MIRMGKSNCHLWINNKTTLIHKSIIWAVSRESLLRGRLKSGCTGILDGQMLDSSNGLYYLLSGNKGVDQLRRYHRTVDLRLCLCVCKNRFSHDAAHMSPLFCILFYRGPDTSSLTLFSLSCPLNPQRQKSGYPQIMMLLKLLLTFKIVSTFLSC